MTDRRPTRFSRPSCHRSARRPVLHIAAAAWIVTLGLPGCEPTMDEASDPSEVEVEFIEANGVEFGYLAQGEGPLVLLVHGFPDTAHSWDEVRPRLAAAGYRAVSPFTRGYAPTEPAPDDRYDPGALADDIVSLIDALGDDEAIVVGHDFGAIAAYQAARMAPERVSKLVTIAIPAVVADQDPEAAMRASHVMYLAEPDAVELMREDDYAHVDELYARWSPTWDFGPEQTQPVKESFSVPGSLEAALAYYRDLLPLLMAPPPAQPPPPIEVPTLTFAGRDDYLLSPEVFDASAVAFSGGYEVAVTSGGHFLHREAPEEFTSILLEFLDRP